MAFAAHALTPSERSALLAAERLGDPFLAHRDAHGDLRIVPLGATERLGLGRTADNDIQLPGSEVSRAHAEMRAAGAGWTVFDDGMSRNGTFVNGERVVRHRRLEDHDVVRIGRHTIMFRSPSAVGEESTAMSDALGEVVLTAGERRVLTLLCRPLIDAGFVTAPASNQEVADALSLSLAGVKSHVRTLSAKLGVDDLPQNRKRAELARRAIEIGLVTARDR